MEMAIFMLNVCKNYIMRNTSKNDRTLFINAKLKTYESRFLTLIITAAIGNATRLMGLMSYLTYQSILF